MKQTKKQSEKKPINVQLSKDDLKELLTVLKDFMVEEIVGYSRVTTHRMDCHNQRLTRLERLTNDQRIKRISSCSHIYKLKSVVYLESTGSLLALKYKCEVCGREYDKPYWLFSWKEKKALRNLGVEL